MPVPTPAQFPVQACAAQARLSPKLAANPIDVSLTCNPRPTVMLAPQNPAQTSPVEIGQKRVF